MSLAQWFRSESPRETDVRVSAIKPFRRFVIHQSPLLFLAMILSTIFLSEALIMVLLTAVLPMSPRASWFIDALLLTVVLSPILYYAVFRPLVVHITESKRTEDALRENETLLETIIESEPECVKLLGPDGTLIRMNRAGLDMIQAGSLEQVKGQCIYQLVAPENREAFKALTGGVFQGKSGTLEFQMIGLKGRRLWLDTYASPLRNERNEIIALLGITRNVTEHKLADQALRESEERYRLLFENNPMPMWVYDIETLSFVAVNEAAIDQYGYSYEEFLAMTIKDIRPLEDVPELARKMATLGTGASRSGLWRHRKKDGTVIWVEIISHGMLYGEKRVRLVLANDVTERKRAEEALQQSEQRYRNLFENAPDVIYTLSTTGLITSLSPSFETVTGFHRADFIGKNLSQIIHPDDLPFAIEQFQRALGGEALSKFELRSLSKSGEYLVGEFVAAPQLQGGKVVGMLGIARDITGRKQMEEEKETLISELQELIARVSRSQREWQETFDNITDVIFLSDLDFKITRVNRAAEKTLGIPLLQLLGKRCHDLFHGTSLAPESCPGHQALKTGKVENSEMYEPRLGSFLDMRVIPRFGKNGELTGLVYVIRDVTERKKLEEQLRHAQKMEAVGQMAAGVAHEVRNPLHALMSITDALHQELKEDPAYDIYLSHIHEQVKRLSSLMKDLLDLGKPVEPASMSPEPLTEICAAAIHLWKHSPLSVGHAVELIHPEDNVNIVVMADGQRLQQVFLNLLDNAAQHGPEGSAIRIIVDRPAGNMIKAYVVDRGSGIPEGLLSRVFEPFFSTRRGGTGLGLSIIGNIVESHGGSLLIRNNVPPPGCTAELSLPIVESSR